MDGHAFFRQWVDGVPKTVHTIMVPFRCTTGNPIATTPEFEVFMDWCRYNLKGRVHVPLTYSGATALNSDLFHRPRHDFFTPYRSFTYGITKKRPTITGPGMPRYEYDFHTLVLCEDKNDVMKIKLAWC